MWCWPPWMHHGQLCHRHRQYRIPRCSRVCLARSDHVQLRHPNTLLSQKNCDSFCTITSDHLTPNIMQLLSDNHGHKAPFMWNVCLLLGQNNAFCRIHNRICYTCSIMGKDFSALLVPEYGKRCTDSRYFLPQPSFTLIYHYGHFRRRVHQPNAGGCLRETSGLMKAVACASAAGRTFGEKRSVAKW